LKIKQILRFLKNIYSTRIEIKQILRFLKNIYSTRVVFFSCINYWMQVFVFNAVGFYGHLKANGLLGYMPIPSSQGLFHRLVAGCPMLDLIWAFKVLCLFILGFWVFRLRTTKVKATLFFCYEMNAWGGFSLNLFRKAIL
jgi:hypothetical protein